MSASLSMEFELGGQGEPERAEDTALLILVMRINTEEKRLSILLVKKSNTQVKMEFSRPRLVIHLNKAIKNPTSLTLLSHHPACVITELKARRRFKVFNKALNCHSPVSHEEDKMTTAEFIFLET